MGKVIWVKIGIRWENRFMKEDPRSSGDCSDAKHAASLSESNPARWMNELQQLTSDGRAFALTPRVSDGLVNQVPSLELVGGSDQVHNVSIHGKNGRSDTVAGIKPEQGESLSHLVKRLHPNLSDEQLAKEVQKVLKYNRDYGNDLGDGKALNSSKDVCLTSVKYVDDRGRISRIEGPTGIVTNVTYDSQNSNVISGYQITGPDGRIVEQARRDSRGNWTGERNGQPMTIKDVDIDVYGDITVTDAAGNKVGHLTRGDDVYTRYKGGKPAESVTQRNGEEMVRYEYAPSDNGYKIYARYPSDPSRRVLVTPEVDEESVKRITQALGEGPRKYAEVVRTSDPEPGDVEPDQYVAARIAKAGAASARAHNSVGWCYAGVADAMDKIGVHLSGRYAYEARGQLLHDRRFQVVSINDLRPGDVLVHGASSAHKAGHIAIYLGKGQEASDHIQSLITGRGYGGTTVFRYVG